MTARRAPGTLLVALLLVGPVLVSGCSDDSGMPDDLELTTYEGPDFTIELPGDPTVTTRTVPSPSGDLEVTFYAVELGAASVSLAVTTVPKGVPTDLDGAVEGGAANVGGTVESSEPIAVDGLRGRDARITGTKDGRDFTAFCRTLAAGRRLFQVIQFVDGEDASQPDSYTEIVQSLEIE